MFNKTTRKSLGATFHDYTFATMADLLEHAATLSGNVMVRPNGVTVSKTSFGKTTHHVMVVA